MDARDWQQFSWQMVSASSAGGLRAAESAFGGDRTGGLAGRGTVGSIDTTGSTLERSEAKTSGCNPTMLQQCSRADELSQT